MICNKNYLADILRICEIKDLIWVMRFQSPLVYIVAKGTVIPHPNWMFCKVNEVREVNEVHATDERSLHVNDVCLYKNVKEIIRS